MLEQSTHRILEILNGMYSYKEKLIYDEVLETDDLKKKKIDKMSKGVNLEFTKKMMDNLDRLGKIDDKKEYARILTELNLSLSESARNEIYPLINKIEDKARLEEELVDKENEKLIDKNSKQITFVTYGNKKVEMGIDDKGNFNLRNCFHARKLEKNDIIKGNARFKANNIRSKNKELIDISKDELDSNYVDNDIIKYQNYIISKRLELDEYADSNDMSDKNNKKKYVLMKTKINKQLKAVSKIIEKIKLTRSNNIKIKQLEVFLKVTSEISSIEESEIFKSGLLTKIDKFRKRNQKEEKSIEKLTKIAGIDNNLKGKFNYNISKQKQNYNKTSENRDSQNKFITDLKSKAISYDSTIIYYSKGNTTSKKEFESYAK